MYHLNTDLFCVRPHSTNLLICYYTLLYIIICVSPLGSHQYLCNYSSTNLFLCEYSSTEASLHNLSPSQDPPYHYSHVSVEQTWWLHKPRLFSILYVKNWPAYPDDPRGLEWPQVLNSLFIYLSVCLSVLSKFSNIISYDNIIWFRCHMISYDIIW